MRARECKLEEMRYQASVGVAESGRIVGLSRAHIYWYRHDGTEAYCVRDIVPKPAVCSRLACPTSTVVSSAVHLPAYLLVPGAHSSPMMIDPGTHMTVAVHLTPCVLELKEHGGTIDVT